MSHIRAQFELTTEIGKVCDLTATRYALGAVHVCPAPDATVFVTATDTKMLAVNRANGTASGEQLISAKLISKTKGTKRILADDRVQIASGRGASSKTVIDDTICDGRFPSVPDVFPASMDTGEWRVITIDAEKLAILARAVSTDGKVTVLVPPPESSFDKDFDPTEINGALPIYGDSGFGLLMPCVSDGKIVRRKDDGGGEIVQTAADIHTARYRERVGVYSDAFRAARAAKAQAEKVAAEESQAARAARL